MINPSLIRNFSIIAHIDHGKSTLADRFIQLCGGLSEREMAEQVLDSMDIERERGITIKAQSVTLEYLARDGKSYQLNIIDTPGHVDFTIEVYRSLKVLDGGVGVFCGSGGVEPQSETNWRYANESEVARVIFVNKLDRVGADFYRVIDQVKNILAAKPLVMVLPIGEQENFVGVVDLLTRKAWVWANTGDPMDFKIEDVPADMVDKVEKYRAELIETAVEVDDDVMESYLEGNEPDIDTLKKCIRKGTINLDFFPAYCGSAFKNKGVQLVLDAVVDYLPNPTEVKPQPEVDLAGVETGEFAIVDSNKPLRSLAFKIMDDRYGALTFVRIYTGSIKKGQNILNTYTGKEERVSRIVRMHADSREELDSAQAGDIVALLGMKNTHTGHTLADPDNPATLEPMVFPDPVISIAIDPKDKGLVDKLSTAIGKMVAEDPSFRVETDEESGETILKGMGELHLDIKVDILKRTYGVEVNVGKPQVAYRETIRKIIQDTYTHKKQSGGSGQFGRIDYTIEPGEVGTGYFFESKVVGGNVPKEYWPAVDKGFKRSCVEGVLAKYPLEDIRFILNDGAFHAVDSSAIAFEIAAKSAYRQSIPKAKPVLLEPIMKIDVFTPEDNVGDTIGDLSRRRGMIQGQDSGPTGVRIKAEAPLSEMFGYIGDLRSMTSGRGQFSMEFSHYAECPSSISEAIIEARAKEKK